MLSKQEKRRDDRIPKRVHVLISENFLGPRPTLQHETNHKNGNKLDNRLANLEWITKSENGKHAWKLKLNHGSSKKIIRSDGEVFNSLAEAARSMKGTLASVCHVLHGRLQTYKGFTFSYSEEKSWR
jgi:uncharacterized protein involved in copper resistance